MPEWPTHSCIEIVQVNQMLYLRARIFECSSALTKHASGSFQRVTPWCATGTVWCCCTVLRYRQVRAASRLLSTRLQFKCTDMLTVALTVRFLESTGS